MTIVAMIVATAHHNIIGKDNQMPWHLPADLAYFKRVTLGKPIVMGRKTFASIGRALPGRKNVVISQNKNFHADGIDVVGSIDEALNLLKDADEVMIIGGGTIYQHCMPVAAKLYVTHIDAELDGDTQFPSFDTEHDWQEIASEYHAPDDKNAYALTFCVYQRR